jgi:carboxyl-terminal processing protease
MHRLQRLWKPLLALGVILVAFTVTFAWPQQNGLDIDIDSSPRAQAARNRDPYDLTELQVLNRVILEVKDHYVEPNRVEPRQMLLASLNAIQRTAPPVLVDYEEGADSLTVQVNNDQKEFRLDDVDSPWSLAGRLRDIFGFLQKRLDSEGIDLRDVEYAATNGMLRTLDPHTVLLTPDVFEEMQMSTRGEFGGLGIVISIRDGHLTVIRPMPDTPASKAGLERNDRIVKINEESTLNMPLSEAVDRLRGTPGSSVTVWVKHKRGGNYGDAKRYEIQRDVIHIDSVEKRMLEDDVAYLKINNFQGNTYEDMRKALADLHKEGMQGLVLDLRDNPGGLLEQAERVADTFLKSGTIVTTSSSDPSQQAEKFAQSEGTEPDYPMVVLVNGGSASASEIVAGAVKNHDRAVVVGQRTFGKGSVQVLYNFRDGSALKLTIAQYLTPGDVSIQNVGIAPDLTIDPMTVDRDDMDIAVDKEYLRESDLRDPLTHERTREVKKQETEVLRYYLPPETRQELREATEKEKKENKEEDEFLTRFSQMLLARTKTSDRQKMLDQAQPVIKQVRKEEMNKAVEELGDLGIDWTVGPDKGPTKVDVKVSTNRPDNTVRAGEDFELKVKVTNTGDNPLYQLRATTESDFQLFDKRELVFGRLEPGKTRSWTTTLGVCETKNGGRKCKIPRRVHDRADGIKVKFSEAHGHAPKTADVRTVVRGLPRPQFAYAFQIADDIQGNGDGKVQVGERVTMYMRVENVGKGRTYETQANLRNLSGEGVLLHDGRFHIDNMKPGDERLVKFTFEVLPDFEKEQAKVEVSVEDMDLRESVTEKVEVPIASKKKDPEPRSGKVGLPEGTDIRARPNGDAPVVARPEGGALVVPAQAALNGYVRVMLESGRPGWVEESETSDAKRGKGTLAFRLNHEPPRLEVDYGDKLVTRSSELQLEGKATDEQVVRDLYIFVGSRKVFYKSNRESSNKGRLTFDTDIPLHGGINYITVFARERDDVMSRETFVVRRDAKDGSLMDTPRFQDDLFGTGMHDGPQADPQSGRPMP